MVIDCDADIRSSTSPSSKKFKSSTNRAIAWTSSSLTRSHDSPSQGAPSLYLATQTAISVWIKRRFGDFLVWKNYILYCLFASIPSHLRSPLLLLLLWWRLCRLLLLLRLLQRQLKNILMAKVIILGTFWTKKNQIILPPMPLPTPTPAPSPPLPRPAPPPFPMVPVIPVLTWKFRYKICV